jgi:hypothetical protein
MTAMEHEKAKLLSFVKNKKRFKRGVVLFVVWIVSFASFFLFVPKYRNLEPLLRLDFNTDMRHAADDSPFTLRASDSGITLEHDNGNNHLRLDAEVEKEKPFVEFRLGDIHRFHCFSVRSRVSIEDVRKNSDGSGYARILFYYRDAEGKGLWDVHHVMFQKTGTCGWEKKTAFFYIPSRAAAAYLYMGITARSGVMRCDDLAVSSCETNRYISVFRLIFLVSGILILLYGISALSIDMKKLILPALVGGLIIAGVLVPGYVINRAAVAIGWNVTLLQKAGHFVFFAILGVIIVNLFIGRFIPLSGIHRNLLFYTLLFSLFLFALFTELLQTATFSRSMRFTDLLIDCAGIVTGAAAVIAITRWKKRRGY